MNEALCTDENQMRIFLIFTIFFLCSSSLLALEVGSEFPEIYRGTWDASKEACSLEWSDARLKISRSTVEYWESSGQIAEILKVSKSELQVKLEMHGEGEKWVNVAVYKLSESSSVITEYFDNHPSFSRVRCETMHNKG
jgi:hypothetical protein